MHDLVSAETLNALLLLDSSDIANRLREREKEIIAYCRSAEFCVLGLRALLKMGVRG
jgi:hypothetical protein